MRRNKLLMPIITGVTGIGLSSSLVGFITSCSCNTKKKIHIEGADTDVKIIGNNMVAYLNFVLDKKLSKGQEIRTEFDEGEWFTFDQPSVKGKLITIPVYWLKGDSVYQTKEWLQPIKFICYDTNKKKAVWTQTIENCHVTYDPYCSLEDDEEMHKVANYINGKTIYVDFKFSIPAGLPSKYDPHLEAHFSVGDYDDNEFTINESDVDIEMESKTIAKVTIPATKKDDTAVAEGDSYKFDMQIYCMYGDTKTPIWISNNFTGFSVAYSAEPKPIESKYLVLEDDPEYGEYGYKMLTGISTDCPATDFNTLEIPSNVIRIGEPTTSNAAGEPINLPNSITKINFAPNSVLTYIEANAFYGNTKIRYIDVSNIPDSTEDLDTMNFKANSFAGWNSDGGTIIWNNELSTYKRHLITTKLYQAGLTYTNWYNITTVTSESQLREACAMGANIQLGANITIAKREDYTGQVNIESSLVMDLNGYKITSAGPIYNYDEKEFATFGVWDSADVVVTDTSTNHNGKIEAFDQRKNGLHEAFVPKDGKDNECFDFYEDTSRGIKGWKPREQRCFYLRTDTPTKDTPSLEILAGEYSGNCTTIFNWNGECWLEEFYRDGKHTYSPKFKTLSPQRAYPEEGAKDIPIDDGAREIINADDTKYSSFGNAYFEVYGAKFYAVQKENSECEPINEFHYYHPSCAECDPDPEEPTGYANWLAGHRYQTIYDSFEEEIASPQTNEWYTLVYTTLKQ